MNHDYATLATLSLGVKGVMRGFLLFHCLSETATLLLK